MCLTTLKGESFLINSGRSCDWLTFEHNFARRGAKGNEMLDGPIVPKNAGERICRVHLISSFLLLLKYLVWNWKSSYFDAIMN